MKSSQLTIPLDIMFRELRHAIANHVPDDQVARRNRLTLEQLDAYRAEFHGQHWRLPRRKFQAEPV